MDLGTPVDPKTIIAIVAAAISAVSAAVSIYASWRGRQLSWTSVKIAQFNTKQLSRAQLRAWTENSVDALSEAYIMLSTEASTEDRGKQRAQLLARLTSSIDKGRWLLPNEEHDSFGTNKGSAYTGLRQAPLDELVLAFNLVKSISGTDFDNRVSKDLLESRRRFTSAIQEKLEPRAVELDLKVMSKKR
jgi:hypothetical protein